VSGVYREPAMEASSVANETNEKERHVQKASAAHVFDRLIDANLQLTKSVSNLVRVSYVMVFLHAALLLYMIWRR